MKIITIAHQKGGVGKSTLTLNIAHILKSLGYKVVLLDADKQGSCFVFTKITDFQCFYLDDFDINPDDFDFCIIDTPPYNTNLYDKIFKISDLIVIPSNLSPLDFMEIEKTIKSIELTQNKYNVSSKSFIVLNRVPYSNSIIEQYREEIKKLEDNYNVQCLNNVIHNRIEISRCVLYKNGILDSSDENAKTELINVVNEILSIF